MKTYSELREESRAALKPIEDLYGYEDINPAILEPALTFDEFMEQSRRERELDSIYDRLPSCGETITYNRKREI